MLCDKDKSYEKDIGAVIKEAIIEHVKSHNENDGKILDAIHHINEGVIILQGVPQNVQNELQQDILKAFTLQGFINNRF